MTNDPCASERYSDNGNLSLRGSGASVVTRQVAGVDCRLVSQQRSSSGSSHGSGSGGHSSGYHTEEQVREESEETSQEGDRHLITSINKVRGHLFSLNSKQLSQKCFIQFYSSEIFQN